MIRPILYIIVIIISLGFAFSSVWPAYLRVETKRTFLSSLDNASNSTDKIKALIGQTTEELLKIDPENLQKFNVFLPETIDEVRLMNNVSHLGAVHGILVEDIHVGEKGDTASPEVSPKTNPFSLPSLLVSSSSKTTLAPSGEKYVTTKAHFSFRAPYKTALVFLGDIEKSLGLMNITALTVSPQDEKGGAKAGSGAVGYRYTVDFETYSLQ